MPTKILSSADVPRDRNGNADDQVANTADAEKPAGKPSIKQALLAAVFAAAIVSVILLAFSWP
ncbi:MAG: hypothetical protein L0L30_17945, partial [Brevibacterium sp.]|nr:hypothetical protein [Brevibacterium sp.]